MASQKTKRTQCEIYSRVVGYLRPINQWNEGKRQEFDDRQTFDKQVNPDTKGFLV
ncbi:MAG: anaerobic ribonucleoside-triphosphate reductase [Candidatus Kuenenbacteria bacterium]